MTGLGTDKPHHLLLATDFSARCDRAQDRAVQLALQWNARLTAVHALGATDVPNDLLSRQGRPNAVERAKRLLEEEFAAIEGLRASVHVEQGKPKNVILDVATKQHCDLIVTGIAGNEPLGQSLLGSTVTALTRSAKVPVLVVKKRVLETNESVVIASDLSEASRAALDLALALFDPRDLTLFHAFEVPFRNWTEGKKTYEQDLRDVALEECERFLAAVTGANRAVKIAVVAQRGDPAIIVADYAADQDVDLVIAGTHGRTGVMNIVLGSVASNLLDEVPCDVMIVPSKGVTGAS